jgi:hypothetical protein
MDLKQYKAKINRQLINGMEGQAHKEKQLTEGTYPQRKCATHSGRAHYVIPQDDYDHLMRRLSFYQGPTINMSGHVQTGEECGGGATFETDNPIDVGGGVFDSDNPIDVGGSFVGKAVKQDEPMEGGKFNFMKSMKHFGKDLGNTAKEVGHAVKKSGIQAVAKEVANEGVKFAKNNIGKLASTAEEMAPEALTVAEEGAPLLLAGGIKKPKRTRNVSQKEANRHALIRKLMQKHGCTLAEASKHIKENKLAY